VCATWRTTLDEVSVWARLDLSPSSGVAVRVTDAVLAGAAAKARGQLQALDVTECARVSFHTLLAVVQANGALRELCAGAREHALPQTLDADCVQRLLQAAPQLLACHAHVLGWNSVPDAQRMLRKEAPFQLLHLRTLRVGFEDDADEASGLEVAEDVAAHASLERVELQCAPFATLAALDAAVDAVLRARQLVSLRFWFCHLVPASAPALVRLVSSGTLTELSIYQDYALLDMPAAALLGAALHASNTITYLHISALLWRDADVAAALLRALTGHRSLRTLKLANGSFAVLEVGAAAGPALGALVAANAPALTELDVGYSSLHDEALRPLFAALPRNTHLRTLDVAHNGMSEAFTRDVLLPAVRANASLRRLVAWMPAHDEDNAFAREAQALVAARGAPVEAAE
jgi:hypothetical protein